MNIKIEIEKNLKAKGFELNSMQIESFKNQGENIVINAPTGSGKTEAILLNLKSNSEYYYFLPTITSCIFMYKRLKDLGVCDVEIKTSIFQESTATGSTTKVIIAAPDAVMIDYLQNKTIKIDGFILDEIDNYPPMVKTAIIDLIKNDNNNTHFIVASATLDEQLFNHFNHFKEIKYNINLKLIKHKIDVVYSSDDIINIIRRNQDKKIGIIRNSIADMEDLMYDLTYHKIKYDYLHSRMTEFDRLRAENKLYQKNFKVFISNDIVSFSVDVDFDILIMDCSDKQSINIQRIGRNNRYNKKVDYTNLYLIHDSFSRELKFVDDCQKIKNFDRLLNSHSLTYNKVKQMKEELEYEKLPSVEYIINNYWEELKKNDFPLNLREVPLNFLIEVEITRNTFNKQLKKLEEVVINTTQRFKSHGMPWAWKSYNYKGEQVFIHLYGKNYEIIGREGSDFLIKEANYDEMFDYDDLYYDDDDYDEED